MFQMLNSTQFCGMKTNLIADYFLFRYSHTNYRAKRCFQGASWYHIKEHQKPTKIQLTQR